MTEAELALERAKKLAFLMTERFSMNPISAKLLNEAWRLAFPDEVAVARRMRALVEALEKAQQHIARQEQILLNQDESLSIRRGELEKAQAQSSKWLEAYHKAVSIGARYEERIAELEEAEQKLCAANVTLDARAEFAERRLAELESRTVKLPELCVGVVQGGHAVMVPYAAGHWFNKTAILEMLAAAGIKWEAE